LKPTPLKLTNKPTKLNHSLYHIDLLFKKKKQKEKMGNVFAPEKPLKEVIRENQRMIKKSIRELEKEIRALETNQKKLENDIRKMAKQSQMVRDLKFT
jgi:predicted DNA-binding transcriptional regulator